MKKEKLEDYQLFYLEIPQSDYLTDLENEYPTYESDSFNEAPCLSEDQVSAIARDQLKSENLSIKFGAHVSPSIGADK